jgi:succinyl-CoA synthetase beta subunit
MNIHEHQAKEVLKSFGAPVARGVAITSLDQAQAAIDALPGPLWVVKSQIHAGGRGKGKFKEKEAGEKGGVRLGFSKEQALARQGRCSAVTWSPHQTGPAGKQVNRLYIEDGADIAKELYLSMLVDRESAASPSSSRPKAAWTSRRSPTTRPRRSSPSRSTRRPASPTSATSAKRSALKRRRGQAADMTLRCSKSSTRRSRRKDMSMLEINPLIVMKDGHLRVLDAKVSFDDNALYRHDDIRRCATRRKKTPRRSRRRNTTSPTSRSTAHRLHGQRRRPRHGDDGHHQALWRRAGQLPRRRRRRHQGEGDRRPSRSSCRTPT